jgi:hypothetical protein
MGIWKPECMRSILRAGAVRAVPVETVTTESSGGWTNVEFEPLVMVSTEKGRPNPRGICCGGV